MKIITISYVIGFSLIPYFRFLNICSSFTDIRKCVKLISQPSLHQKLCLFFYFKQLFTRSFTHNYCAKNYPSQWNDYCILSNLFINQIMMLLVLDQNLSENLQFCQTRKTKIIFELLTIVFYVPQVNLNQGFFYYKYD